MGHSFWMDAAVLASAGVETVVIGPSGAGAHADVEWVDLGSVHRLAEILARTAVTVCR
jgi:acetylornithine deacetylase